MEKIVFYCRTSTSTQEQEQSIQTQIQKLREVYKNRNVIQEYLDEGYSGAYMQRPALEQLREDAKMGLFNILALYSLDRLSRKTGHSLVLQDEFLKLGISIEVLGENLKNTPEGKLSSSVLSAISEYERDHIRQRMMDGIYRRINNGIIVGCNPGFGYRLIKRDKQKGTEARFEIEPREAESVKKIFKIFLKSKSLAETARIITKTGLYNGKIINAKRTGEILKRKTYIGNFYYGKSYPCEVKKPLLNDGKTRKTKRPKPESEWKRIECPAIIDKETFERAQEILRTIRKNFIHKTKYEYLCQGLIRCLHCGKFYRGKKCSESKGVPYHAYGCYGKWNTAPGETKCKSKGIGGKTLERFVWDYIKGLVENPDRIKKSIKILREERESKKGDNKKIYDRLLLEINNIKVKKSKILDLYSDNLVPKEELNKKIQELNQEEGFVSTQLKETEKQLAGAEQIDEIEREIENTCLEFEKKMKNLSFEKRKRIVNMWVKEINVFDNGSIKIRVRVPILEGIPFYPNIPNCATIGYNQHERELCFEQLIKI